MNDALLGLLGIARRSGSLSLGRNASIEAVEKRKAKLCVLSSDASARLERELDFSINKTKNVVPMIRITYSMNELYKAIGYKACVLTVNNDGFAQRVQELYLGKTGEEF